MLQLFDEHPLLIPVACCSFGIYAGFTWAMTVPYLMLLVLFAVLVSAALIRSPVLFRLLLMLLCFGWGVNAIQPELAADTSPSQLGVGQLAGRLVVEGVVAGRPVDLPEGQRFELQLEQIFMAQGGLRSAGRLLVTVAKGSGDWLTGDRVRIQGSLRQPRLLGLPGEFDYSRYLTLRGIDATLWVQDAAQVVLMRTAAGFSWQRQLDRAARKCNQAIRLAVEDPAATAVLMALVTGSQAAVPPDLLTAYARSGASHILSISGFHVAIVAATVAQLLLLVLVRWEWLALRLNLRRGVLLATLPVMVGYLLFTGGAPATARSVVMLAAVVVALWVERETQILDALLLAALLLLVINPAVLFDLSFQLSFLALWGIIVLTPLLLAPLEGYLSGWRHKAALFFASSLAAVLATAVPALVNFYQASLTGVLANLVVVPLLGYGAVLLGAVAAPLVFVVPTLAGMLFGLAGWLVELSNSFVVWVAAFPVLRSYQIGGLHLVASIAALSVLSFVVSCRLRLQLLGLLVVLLLTVHLWPAHRMDDRVRVTFLSVGQGDATLLQFPDNSTMLIDGGGYLQDTGRDFGERYLVPALYRLGVNRVDRLVLTHPHPDHLGGLPAVAEQLPVGEFWYGPWQGAVGAEYARLLKALRRHNVPIRELRGGSSPFHSANCQITVLSPSGQMGQMGQAESGPESGNELSLVLRLDYKRFSALFMADAGHPVEEQMLQQGSALPATLLKVGHHGSRSSTGELFIARVRPQLAVISVGADNRFGLPSDLVVSRLDRSGVRILRTDLDGTLAVESDGDDYRVVTHLEGR